MNFKNTLPNTLFLAGSIAISLGILGCGPKGVTDQALATDVQAKLYGDPAARSANVKVSAANGVLTLSGDVPSSEVALQVVNIANGTSGVKSVDNQLKIVAAVPAASAVLPALAAAPVPAMPAKSSLVGAPPAPPTPIAESRPPAEPAVRHSETASAAPAPQAPIRPATITIPAGENVGITMIDGISSKTNTSGQTFRASLSSPIVVNGRTAIPSGAGATVLLANSKSAARIKGSAELEVRLVSIQHAGHSYDVDSTVHEEVGKGRGKQTAVRSGIGAAAGAVIGAIAGGGKGAAIGTLAGGGAGAGFQLATHGQQVTIPSESRLTFTLQSPVIVTLRERREQAEP